MTGTCYNFEMEEFFSSFLRRAGMPASAGLSCLLLSLQEPYVQQIFYQVICRLLTDHPLMWSIYKCAIVIGTSIHVRNTVGNNAILILFS